VKVGIELNLSKIWYNSVLCQHDNEPSGPVEVENIFTV
jgi:hypothetical protein